MKRRWLLLLLALMTPTYGQDRITKQRALEIATGWVRRNYGTVGRKGKPLQFDKASVEEGTWKNAGGETRSIWFVHFPEQGVAVEPNGIAVRVDQLTGDCERAVLE